MTNKRKAGRVPNTQRNPPPKRALHYKVVELSSVDESSLERTINEWSERGWAFDGVQFAMRESSKRPCMAFVFFTREGGVVSEPTDTPESFRGPREAHEHLRRLAQPDVGAPLGEGAWARLQALAQGEEEGP